MQSESERMFNGPIAGENYTSDTRNYPWHRPPDLSDYDEIVEAILTQISNEYTLPAIMGSLSMGGTVAGVTDYLILSNIGKGKFSIDMGLLAAGPVARFIQIMADDFGVDYDMGIETEFTPISPKMAKLIREGVAEDAGVDAAPVMGDDTTEDPLMSPSDVAPMEEQDAMLGYSEEQDPDAETLNGIV
jgi:hypothetical protein